MFALLVYLAAALPTAAGAAILCVGVDGHVAVESTYVPSYRVGFLEDDPGAEHVGDSGKLDSHHATPCKDVRLSYLQGRRGGNGNTKAATTFQPQAAFNVEISSLVELPSSLATIWYCGHSGIEDPTLRCLRTVKLIN